MVDGTKKADGGVNVDAGDDEFLYTERRHLNALHRVERTDVSYISCGVLAVRQYGSWYVEAESVHYDHGQDAAEDNPFSHDQVKP